MGSFRQEPYLWVHLAGLATVPLWLDLCLVGLATGIPRVPPIIELALLVLLGSGPILWMQWRRPFSIFSLLVLVLPPDLLTEDQRRILRLFKSPVTKALSLLVPLGLTWTLLQLYRLAPIAASVTPLHTGHTVGFLVALFSFLACNLFIQVPLSVLRVLAVRPKRFALVDPYPVEEIPQDFTMLGLRVNKILPEIGAVIQPEAVDGADAGEVEPVGEEPSAKEPVAEEPEVEADLVAVEPDEADEAEADLVEVTEAAAAVDEDSEELEQPGNEQEEDFGDDPDEDLDADFGDRAATDALADAPESLHSPESPDVADSVEAGTELVAEADDSEAGNLAEAEVDAKDEPSPETDTEVEAVETAEVAAEQSEVSEADTSASDLEAQDLETDDAEPKDMEDVAESETAAADDSTDPTAETDKEIS